MRNGRQKTLDIKVWAQIAGRWNDSILLFCGYMVDSAANKLFINCKGFAHNPQTIFYKVLNEFLYTFLCPQSKQVLHNLFTRFYRLLGLFYTQSTVTITTTKYINI
jgi:hypothetical protein